MLTLESMAYSRFHLADLQVHSPADAQQRYGDVGGPDPNEYLQQLVGFGREAGPVRPHPERKIARVMRFSSFVAATGHGVLSAIFK
jgi:hypothetical protein